MTSRRGILKNGVIGGGLVFGGLVIIGGLASETDLIDDPQDEDDSEDEPSDSAEPNDETTSQDDESGSNELSQTRETLRDERLRTQTRWPHEFEAGNALYVTIEVDESGPAGFTIFHDEERDVGESWIVELEDTIEYEVQLDGLHQLVVDPNGVVDVVIEVEGARD